MKTSRRSLLAGGAVATLGAGLPLAWAAARPTITVYKSAT
jgi:hypothetical protein